MSTFPTEKNEVTQLFKKYAIKHNGAYLEPKELHDLLESFEVPSKKPQITALLYYFGDEEKLSLENFISWWEIEAKNNFTKIEYQ